MTMVVWLIRHAEHQEYDHRLSGRRPGIALSARGRCQADRLGRRMAEAGLDLIETSPLERTRETASAVATATAAPVRVEPALIEIDMGQWGGRRLDSFDGDPAWQAWNEHRGSARIPGGESMAEVQARIVGRLQALVAAGGDRAVALITHADLVRAAVCWALGLSLDNLLRFDIDPASVSRLVVGTWGARVMSVNERVEGHG